MIAPSGRGCLSDMLDKVTGVKLRGSADNGAGPHWMVAGPQLICVHDSIDRAGLNPGRIEALHD